MTDLDLEEQGLVALAEQLLQKGDAELALPDRPAWKPGMAEHLMRRIGDPADKKSEQPKRVGERVGHYRVQELLGQGGMGAVYCGVAELLDRKVAIKTLRFREGALNTQARARFVREAKSLAKLDHPGICKVYDFVEQPAVDGSSEQFLILELVEGETLRAALNGKQRSRSQLLQILEDIATAVACAHEAGVIHRDLKPDNVMLDGAGVVKVMDFGIARWHLGGSRDNKDEEVSSARLGTAGAVGDAKVAEGQAEHSRKVTRPRLDDKIAVREAADRCEQSTLERGSSIHPTSTASAEQTLTLPGAVLGTPSFMSPEQLQGERVTVASDVYGLGLIAMEVLTGDRLREGGEDSLLSQVRRGETPGVSGTAREALPILKASLQTDPKLRPTAMEVADRFRNLRLRPQKRRSTAFVAAAVLVLLFSLGIAAWTRWQRAGEAHAVADLPRPVRMLVLPFENRTGDEAMAWVELGLRTLVTDSLRTNLDVELVPLDRTVSVRKMLGGGELEDLDHDELLRETGAHLLLAVALHRQESEVEGSAQYVLEEVVGIRNRRRSERKTVAADPTLAAHSLADRLVRRIDPGAVLKETHSGDPFVDRLYAMAVSGNLRSDDAQDTLVLLRHVLDNEPEFHRARLERGAALVKSSAFAEARAVASTVRSTAETTKDRTLLLRALDLEISIENSMGKPDAALQKLEDLEAKLSAPPEDGQWHVRVATRRSHAYISKGDTEAAREILTKLVGSLRGQSDRQLDLVYALFRTGVLEQNLRRFEQAHRMLSEALSLARQEGMVLTEGQILNSIAVTYEIAGDIEQALVRYAESEKIAVRVGALPLQQSLMANRASLLHVQKEFEESYALNLEALELTGELGSAQTAALINFNLANTACVLGKLEAAREHFVRAKEFYPMDTWDMQFVHGWIQLLERNDEALQTLLRAKELAGEAWEPANEEVLERAR